MTDRLKAVLIFAVSFAVGVLLYFSLSKIKPKTPTSSKNTISKIISLSPSITETVFALGEGNKLVGRSDFCDYPPKVTLLPSVGNNFSIKFSKILSLKPDIILSQGENTSLTRFSNNHGFRLDRTSMDSIKTIKEGILKLGKSLGVSKKAKALVENIVLEIKKSKALRGSIRPKVLVLLNRNPSSFSNIMTCGSKSFISEALEIAGGKNVFNDAKINYSNISLESIIRRNPDIIIEINALPGFNDKVKKEILNRWKMFAGINAVRNSRIFFVKGQRALIPGPGIVDVIRRFQDIIKKARSAG